MDEDWSFLTRNEISAYVEEHWNFSVGLDIIDDITVCLQDDYLYQLVQRIQGQKGLLTLTETVSPVLEKLLAINDLSAALQKFCIDYLRYKSPALCNAVYIFNLYGIFDFFLFDVCVAFKEYLTESDALLTGFQDLLAFVENVLDPQIQILFQTADKAKSIISKTARYVWIQKNARHFTSLMTEYPDTYERIHEIRSCLLDDKSNLGYEIFSKECIARLCDESSSLSTEDIVMNLAFALEPLRLLDPTFKLVQNFGQAAMAVLLLLAFDKGSQFADQFKSGSPALFHDSEADPWRDFTAEMMEFEDMSVPRFLRRDDVFGVLVNLWNSAEDMTNEYKRLFVRQLFEEQEIDDGQLTGLELLKIKIPEGSWKSCDVIFSDFVESCTKYKKSNSFVQFLPISDQYWPDGCKKDCLTLLASIEEEVKSFETEFSKIRPGRKLEWLPCTGIVDMDIVFSNCVKNFKCPPVHAVALLSAIEANRPFVANDLNVNDGEASIKFWVKNNVITREAAGTYYRINEEWTENSENCFEQRSAEQKEQEPDYSTILWSYISNMLINLGPLPLERIHALLTIFASQFKLTTEQVQRALNVLLAKELICFDAANEVYKRTL